MRAADRYLVYTMQMRVVQAQPDRRVKAPLALTRAQFVKRGEKKGVRVGGEGGGGTSSSLPPFSSAMRTLFTLLGCPLPMPSRRPLLATVMALLLTCFTANQANLRASNDFNSQQCSNYRPEHRKRGGIDGPFRL